MIRGTRSSMDRGSAKGICPECRTLQRLLISSGKICAHGRTPEKPRGGCPGTYQNPLRTDSSGKPITGGNVVGWRQGDPHPIARNDPPAGEPDERQA